MPSRLRSVSEMSWSCWSPGVSPPISMASVPVLICVKSATVRIAGEFPGASVPWLSRLTLMSAPLSDDRVAFCVLTSVPWPWNVASFWMCAFWNSLR